jgi:uncharacterized protein (TIGR03790 family)
MADDADSLAKRVDLAMRSTLRALSATPDRAKVQRTGNRLKEQLERLYGKVAILESSLRGPVAMQQADARETLAKIQRQVADAQSRRYDATARKQLRDVQRDWFGAIGIYRTISQQTDYLAGAETAAALDNELALLWWPAYPRSKWAGNPLYYKVAVAVPASTLMVMRLDAPNEELVRKIIGTSIEVEQKGLSGPVAIDAGGAKRLNPKMDNPGYWQFEKAINELHAFLKAKTKLDLVYDDSATIFPAGSARNVALYVGWYQLRNYAPGFTLAPGSVGYHVASLELVSLRGANERGWAAGLLKDGIAATLGPVAEPYLHSFPSPEEFFPLLLTGKLTLAEVYWKTTPCTSWMISMIGDPLYTPYEKTPALKVEDLPEKLRSAVK